MMMMMMMMIVTVIIIIAIIHIIKLMKQIHNESGPHHRHLSALSRQTIEYRRYGTSLKSHHDRWFTGATCKRQVDIMHFVCYYSAY